MNKLNQLSQLKGKLCSIGAHSKFNQSDSLSWKLNNGIGTNQICTWKDLQDNKSSYIEIPNGITMTKCPTYSQIKSATRSSFTFSTTGTNNKLMKYSALSWTQNIPKLTSYKIETYYTSNSGSHWVGELIDLDKSNFININTKFSPNEYIGYNYTNLQGTITTVSNFSSNVYYLFLTDEYEGDGISRSTKITFSVHLIGLVHYNFTYNRRLTKSITVNSINYESDEFSKSIYNKVEYSYNNTIKDNGILIGLGGFPYKVTDTNLTVSISITA